MCIVIDANTLSAVFDPTNEKHQAFRPVFEWILRGRGKVVYGGTTYAREAFERVRRFNKLFQELRRLGKAVVLPSAEVDAEERRVRAIEPSVDFDDPHIVAIVEVSGCTLLCSDDRRADKYIKEHSFYQRRSCPKIYREATHHAELLTDGNIAECCRPNRQLARHDTERLTSVL